MMVYFIFIAHVIITGLNFLIIISIRIFSLLLPLQLKLQWSFWLWSQWELILLVLFYQDFFLIFYFFSFFLFFFFIFFLFLFSFFFKSFFFFLTWRKVKKTQNNWPPEQIDLVCLQKEHFSSVISMLIMQASYTIYSQKREKKGMNEKRNEIKSERKERQEK